MRILGPIVLAQPLLMARRQSDIGPCRAVRAQLIGHQNIGCEALFLEQLAHQFSRLWPCRAVVAPAGREPRLRRQPRATAKTAGPQSSRPSRRDAIATLAEGVDGEGLERTMARTSRPSHRFVGHIEPAFSERIFDVAIAERETHIEPHGVPDDRGRKLVAGKRDRHPPSYPANRGALLLP